MKKIQQWLQQQREVTPDGKLVKTSKDDQSHDAGASEVETELFTFDYDVKNFRYLSETTSGPVFKGGVKSGHEWLVAVTPAHKEKEKEHVGVKLILNKSSNGKSVQAAFSISLFNSDRKIIYSKKTMTTQNFEVGKSWGWTTYLPRSDVIKSKSRYLSGGHLLKFHVKIFMVVGVTHKKFSMSQHDMILTGSQQNSTLDSKAKVDRMKSFLVDGNFADVLLKTSTNTFPASKIILAAHSPVFTAMFSSGMLESKENIVKIEDLSDEAVQGLLQFLYTGQCDLLEKNPGEMLSIADKYQVTNLKNKCESTLLNDLNLENAADILTAAHLHSSTSLKPNVVTFVNRNRTQVQQTDSYKRMAKMHPAILADLYSSIE